MADNILLGNISEMDREGALEQVKVQLRKLDVLEEIQNLPQGIHTPLGKLDEGSVDLSGGQWQRVAMARGLMSRALIQILDEPTAALGEE